MKLLIVLATAVLALAAALEPETTLQPEALETASVAPLKLDSPKYSPTQLTRDLPADVLRDFPGLCFASTLCRVFEVGVNWELKPFCGNSTCLLTPDGFLVERVEDCGILPKANSRCQIINEDAKNVAFPSCCPIFQCEKGVTVEYPTQQELQASFINSELPESSNPVQAPGQ